MRLISAATLVLATLGAASGAFAADGKAVFEKTCAACHATGAAGAPKLGDKEAWAPRVASGKAALVASVTNGKGAMPPKGGNTALSADDLGAAVDYMISNAK
jgi:cytochrome c5